MVCQCPDSGSPVVRADARPGELAPWTRLKGATGATTITQAKDEWLDVSGFRHGVLCVDVRDFDNSVFIYLQSSNTLNEEDFTTLTSYRPTGAGKKYYVIDSTATTPLLRYLRWKVGDASGAWRLTFRLMASLKGRG